MPRFSRKKAAAERVTNAAEQVFNILLAFDSAYTIHERGIFIEELKVRMTGSTIAAAALHDITDALKEG